MKAGDREDRREGQRRSSIKSKVMNTPIAAKSGLREGGDIPGLNSKIKENRDSGIK